MSSLSETTSAQLPHIGRHTTERRPLDNQIEVMTPENIAFNHVLAGPFQRFLAFLLDVLISYVAYWLLAGLIILGVGFVANATFGFQIAGEVSMVCWAIALGLSLFVSWGYGAYMETYYNGRTFGKMLTHQRVLNIDGNAISGIQAIVRNFFRTIDLFPLVPVGMLIQMDDAANDYTFIPTGLFGLLFFVSTRNFQRIGDVVAGTIVVVERSDTRSTMSQFADPRVAQLASELAPDFVVGRSMATALSNYVERRDFLGRMRIDEIASRIAPKLKERLGLPADTNNDLLLCALYHRTFLTNNAAGGASSWETPPTIETETAHEQESLKAEPLGEDDEGL
ncbi:MAG: RDD family protein [Pirellulaceae bacterium]